MNLRRLLVFGVVGLVVITATAFGVDRMLLADLREKADRLDRVTRDVGRYQEAVAQERRRVRSRVDAVSPRMLPGGADELQHTFRALLATLGAEAGLVEVTVSSASPAPEASPVGASRLRSTTVRRRLRTEPGVSVLRGNLRGVATLEQAFALLSLAEQQPWVHSVEGFEVAPAERTRERFTVRLDIATIRVAGIEPAGSGAVVPMGEANRASGSSLAGALAFREPPAPPPPAQPAPEVVAVHQPPPPPPPPEYDAWRVSAVVERSAGTEVWLVRDGGGSRTLLIGEGIAGAVVREADARHGVVFEINGALWRVGLGGGLRDRTPVQQSDVAVAPGGEAVASGAGE